MLGREKTRAHNAHSKEARRGVSNDKRNTDYDELEETGEDTDCAGDDQAKTDAAVKRGEELVKWMPEVNDGNLDQDLNLE